MSRTRLLLATALGWAIGPVSVSEVPVFAPAPGSDVTKTFRLVAGLDLDDLAVVVDGQNLGAMLGDLVLTGESTRTLVVSDTYAEVEDGRPTRLERSYDSLAAAFSVSMSTGFGGEEQQGDLTSALEGTSVVFRLDPEDGDYRVEFSEGEDDEDLLAGVREDMDLRLFLPDDDVAGGDSWEVDVADLVSVLFPGGDMLFELEDSGVDELDLSLPDEDLREFLQEALDELLEGTCTCTLDGVRNVDGERLAEIRIEIEIPTAVDLADPVSDLIETIAEEKAKEVDFELDVADLDIDLVAEGLLLWNLDAGRFESLELDAEASIALDVSLSAEEDNLEHAAEASLEVSLSLELDAFVEQVP